VSLFRKEKRKRGNKEKQEKGKREVLMHVTPALSGMWSSVSIF
jgi:hypothetical protein